MIPGLEQTPPEMAYLLGFFMALSLRQGRLAALIDRAVPARKDN